MAFAFGDSFDLYAAVTDALAGYWDGSTNSNGMSLVAGRFTGSQALQFTSGASGAYYKNSGSNDAVHHIVCAERQTAALTGTTSDSYISFGDGATAQCSVVFRSDGAMLLTSGGPTGATLDTYTGAVTAQNTWTAFEIEVVINNTTGSWTIRKNGNTGTADHAATSLNTRGGTTNNYASRMTVGMQTGLSAQQLDDLLWRSDPSSVSWVGDIRCYTRMPASDVSTQFSRSPVSMGPSAVSTVARAANATSYFQITPTYSGTISAITISLSGGVTGHFNVALYDRTGTGSGPGNILATGVQVTNPATGANTVTFVSPATVVQGTSYLIGVDQDTSITYSTSNYVGGQSYSGTTTYASFPVANPAPTVNGGTTAMPLYSLNITPSHSFEFVNEPQQDGATSYVYDSNVGDGDLYSIASIGGLPASVVAVTTRGFFEKSDAGTRGAQVQLKSGSTTVGSTATALSTSFGWLYRTDLVDPNTSAAWSGAAVDSLQVGPKVTS